MKPNQRGRFNGRFNNNNNAPRTQRPQTIMRNTSLESTGPCGKLRGTALQLHEKYLAAAKDAQIQNDDVLAETCFQYADHYMHIQNQAIANEQAFHAQQLINRMPPTTEQPSTDAAAEPAAQPVAGEVPPAPTTAAAPEGQLKVVDVSIPIDAMNAQSTPAPAQTTPQTSGASQPIRRILRPRMEQKTKVVKKKTPASTTTPRQDFFPVSIEE